MAFTVVTSIDFFLFSDRQTWLSRTFLHNKSTHFVSFKGCYKVSIHGCFHIEAGDIYCRSKYMAHAKILKLKSTSILICVNRDGNCVLVSVKLQQPTRKGLRSRNSMITV